MEEDKIDREKDNKYVSNETHEIDYFAKQMGVTRAIVMAAKELTGSSEREVLEDYINSLTDEDKCEE